jgi:hypothetical protein
LSLTRQSSLQFCSIPSGDPPARIRATGAGILWSQFGTQAATNDNRRNRLGAEALDRYQPTSSTTRQVRETYPIRVKNVPRRGDLQGKPRESRG